MRSGQLRHLIILQKPTTVKGSMGEELITYVDEIKNVPASIKPLTGREYLAARQTQEEVTTQIKTRYFSNSIDGSWRIKWGSRIYKIASVMNVGEMNKELMFMCEEIK